MSSSHDGPSSSHPPSSTSPPLTPALSLPHNLNVYICRHGERVDQVFGIDWIEQAFRTYKIHGAEERAERERMEALAARRKQREARRQAKREVRRHSEAQMTDSSSEDEAPPLYNNNFRVGNGGGGMGGGSGTGLGQSDLHHASYVRFNLNMPKDLPSRMPRRDITHFAEDAPLTECGHWQAGLVGEALQGANIQYVYASPALRCVQTAHDICMALGLIPPNFSTAATPASTTTPAASFPVTTARTHPVRSHSSGSFPSPFTATPPSFSGIRIEYGLFEWMGWYQKYPHWLSSRELASAGLMVDTNYVPVSLRPKQGETQREWYLRSSLTMQRILQRHFGTVAGPNSSDGNGGGGGGAGTRPRSRSTSVSLNSSSQRGPDGLPMLNLPGATNNSAAVQPLLYTHGNILFVGHAGSLDTLSYGLLHSHLPRGPDTTSHLAPSQVELSMGKRMRLFSNYCGIGRIQYIKHHMASVMTPLPGMQAVDGTNTPLFESSPHMRGTSTADNDWASRRNSLTLGVEDTSLTEGFWQISDDSNFDMTNTSNDPFSFQLSYASYQKTMAHLMSAAGGKVVHSPQSVHTLASIQKQIEQAQAEGAREDGVDAVVISSSSGGPTLTVPTSSSSSSSLIPTYTPAMLAPVSERMLDMNFRKQFGALLDSCNSLANFLLTLNEKQTEKLGQRVTRTTAIDMLRGSELLSPARQAFLTASINDADSSLSSSSSSSSSSISPPPSSPSCTVLESWILQEIAKNAPSILQVLPREWSTLLGYHHDALTLHVYKLMIALRRFVVPMKRWSRLKKQEKNIISWTCMLHHIARSDCMEDKATTSSNATSSPPHDHPPQVRCDFLCSLSSCITAVDILARQGFANKDPATGAPLVLSPNAPLLITGTGSHHITNFTNSRELQEWIRRAEKMRRELKEAKDGKRRQVANAGQEVAAAAASSSTTSASSLAAPPSPLHASRPSTPPPSSLCLPLRTDGYPHSYDLLELVSSLEPIFGTDTVCSDILKAILLHPLLTGLVSTDSHSNSQEEVRNNQRARQLSQSQAQAQAQGAPVTAQLRHTAQPQVRARYHSLLLANSNNDSTTSLSSSSTLPHGADAVLNDESPNETTAAGAGAGAAADVTTQAAAASSSSSSRHTRQFSVPSSLLSILPSCLSPRLFDCLYLFSLAHLSANFLTHPHVQQQVLAEFQQKVHDVKQMWRLARQARQEGGEADAEAGDEPITLQLPAQARPASN